MFGTVDSFGRDVVKVATLSTTQGFNIIGDLAGDQSGWSVSAAGDVNGDGIDDIAIGARFADGAGSNSGEVYILFGKTSGFGLVDLTGLASRPSEGFIIRGPSTDSWAGASIASGDVNGDGFDDVVIGSPSRFYAGGITGNTYVVYGKASGFSTVNLAGLENRAAEGFVVRGIASRDSVGTSVSTADVNGDGFDDVLIGAPDISAGGATNNGVGIVIFGKASTSGLIQLSTLQTRPQDGFFIFGDANGDSAGHSIASAGDVNGDGFEDIVIGAPYADVAGNAGEAYVIFGKASGFGTIDLTGLASRPAEGFIIRGDNAYDNAGYSVSSAGDVNGDGFDDLLIGAPGNEDGGQYAGGAYVVFGKASGFGTITLATLAPTAGFMIQGGQNDEFGKMVAAAGDVNRDGYADIIVGAPFGSDGGQNAGEAYVIFGRAGPIGTLSGGRRIIDVDTLAPADGFIVQGEFTSLVSRRSVAAAGDFNGDGVDDILVGAPFSDQGGNDAGETYLIFGKAAPPPAVIRLADLNGANGFVIPGIDADDLSGFPVAGAGDVNGDGYADIIIGAINGDPGGRANAGESYVVFGKAGGFGAVLPLSSLNGTNGFRMNGVDAADRSGRSVASAGDVNGDGFDDVIVGAYAAAPGGRLGAGESYVVFGKAGGFTADVELSALNGTNGFRIDGIDAGDAAGFTVGSAGDFNGDGYDDLMVGAWSADPGGRLNAGETYIVFGKASGFGASINLSALNGTNGFIVNGIAADDRSSRSAIASAGDINKDGYDDIVIGAYRADPAGRTSAGETYVIFGKAGGMPANLELSALNGTNGFRIVGIDANDFSGGSVSSAGDVNGDGYADIIISGEGGNSGRGESYVVFGKAGGFGASIELSSLNGTNGFRIDGTNIGDLAGESVSSAGDFNGDGFDDLLVGAYGADPDGRTDAGSTYIIFGKAGGFGASIALSSLNGVNGLRIDGIDTLDESGQTVAALGDVNGDGFDDIAIGAYLADPDGRVSAGETYIVFGSSTVRTLFATDDAFTVGATGQATGNLLANDTARAGIVAVGGSPKLGTVTLASGALLTIGTDGAYTYNPNGAFTLGRGETATDSFSYRITGGDTATVNVTVTGATTVEPPESTNANNRMIIQSGKAASVIEGAYNVFGTNAGSERITVYEGTTAILQGDFARGGDVVVVKGPAGDFSAQLQGSNVVLQSLVEGIKVSIPVGTVGLTVRFENAQGQLVDDRIMRYDGSKIVLGAQTVTTAQDMLTDYVPPAPFGPPVAAAIEIAPATVEPPVSTSANNRLIVLPGKTAGLIDGAYDVFGSNAGSERVTIYEGTTANFQGDFARGGDTIVFKGPAGDFSAQILGSSVVVKSLVEGMQAIIPVGTVAVTLRFENAQGVAVDNRALLYDGTKVVIGTQTITGVSDDLTDYVPPAGPAVAGLEMFTGWQPV